MPERQNIKKGGLDQCGAERFSRLTQKKCGTERVNVEIYAFSCMFGELGQPIHSVPV